MLYKTDNIQCHRSFGYVSGHHEVSHTRPNIYKIECISSKHSVTGSDTSVPGYSGPVISSRLAEEAEVLSREPHAGIHVDDGFDHQASRLAPFAPSKDKTPDGNNASIPLPGSFKSQFGLYTSDKIVTDTTGTVSEPATMIDAVLT